MSKPCLAQGLSHALTLHLHDERCLLQDGSKHQSCLCGSGWDKGELPTPGMKRWDVLNPNRTNPGRTFQPGMKYWDVAPLNSNRTEPGRTLPAGMKCWDISPLHSDRTDPRSPEQGKQMPFPQVTSHTVTLTLNWIHVLDEDPGSTPSVFYLSIICDLWKQAAGI